MNEGEFDVDSLRTHHESNHEWELRRAFILEHRDKFQESRLLCLASCFVSVECYGCRYPEGVMKQLDELGLVVKSGIGKCRPLIGQLPGVKFVKSSENADRNNLSLREKDSEAKSETSLSPRLSKQNASSSKPSVQSSAMEEKFYSLASSLKDVAYKSKSAKNDAEIVQMALDKMKMVSASKFTQTNNGFRCDLQVDCVLISTAEAPNKKAAKLCAHEKATEVLRKPYLKIEKICETKDDYRLIGSIEPFEGPKSLTGFQAKHNFNTGITKLGKDTNSNIQSLAKIQKSTVAAGRKRPATALNDIFAEFVVMEHEKSNAVSVLNQSANACRMDVKYDFVELPDGKSRCQVFLDGSVLMDFVGETKITAKAEAAERVLRLLKKCYTIVCKKSGDAESTDTVQRDTVVNDTQKSQVIPESNIGSRLLKKIGWTGGGLGKEGNEGIVEPVSLESAINRAGLGLKAEKGISKEFTQKIQQIIEDYMRSEKQEELVFSPTFTKDERAIIHQQSRKYQLKTKSHGHDEDRYLVLSRKRTPLELVRHITANGGETNKYILKPPGSS